MKIQTKFIIIAIISNLMALVSFGFINNKINIGKYAAETTTSELTQRLLSAKHLLESNIKKIEWTNNYFFELFEIDGNTIKLIADNNLKNLNNLLNLFYSFLLSLSIISKIVNFNFFIFFIIYYFICT